MVKRCFKMLVKDAVTTLFLSLFNQTARNPVVFSVSGIRSPGFYLFFFLTTLLIATPALALPPVIGDTVASQAVDDTSTVSPFSTVTITDPEVDNVDITITLDDTAKFLRREIQQC